MSKSNRVEFIKKAGACIVSKNIIEGKGRLKWLIRAAPIDKIDNGWRFFSEIDNNEYINNSDNLLVCDFNMVANIEPAIIGIYLLPVEVICNWFPKMGSLLFGITILEKR